MPQIEVSCGVLINSQRQILLVERPAGKIAAGKWEFPGGKIETGEPPRTALDRELEEELAVTPTRARPLICFTHQYSDRIVRLHTFLIESWNGQLTAVEGQRMQWCDPGRLPGLDLLPTVWPSLQALRLPDTYVFTPDNADLTFLLAGLDDLPANALLRLRLPGLGSAAYQDLAQQLIKNNKRSDLRLILDRGEAMARELGAQGCHYRQQDLPTLTAQSNDSDLLRIASCHDADSLGLACEKGADAVVLGSVGQTPSHPGSKTLGWSGFRNLATQANRPVYAIGGLARQDLETAFRHYAQGVAGISAYWSRSGS